MGAAGFTYAITNGNGGTASATVSLTVSASTLSLFDSSSVPVTVTVNDTNSVELGVKFQTSAVGKITGVRFYKGPQNTGNHTGNLWTQLVACWPRRPLSTKPPVAGSRSSLLLRSRSSSGPLMSPLTTPPAASIRLMATISRRPGSVDRSPRLPARPAPAMGFTPTEPQVSFPRTPSTPPTTGSTSSSLKALRIRTRIFSERSI